MSDSSIKLINRASLLEQREKLLEALAETEGILKALGWEPEAASESVPTVKAVRPRRRIRIAPPGQKFRYVTQFLKLAGIFAKTLLAVTLLTI